MDNRLKCTDCGCDLELRVAFDGCDWDTVDGENSGYKYPISLICVNDNCARVYTIGRLKNQFDFSASNTETRPFIVKKRIKENHLLDKYVGRKEGVIVYDSKTERMDIKFDLEDCYGGLHCGECFDVKINDEWVPTRIEFKNNWYLIDVDADIIGLKVRI